MNLFEHMDAMASSFTKTDHYIYTQCKKFTTDFAEDSITMITQNHNISQPALTRFAKKLGFSGFNEFQFALAMQVEDHFVCRGSAFYRYLGCQPAGNTDRPGKAY